MAWKGWAYSEDYERYRKVLAAEDIPLIEAGINQILNTIPGERRMRPDFGSYLRKHVFDPHDPILYAEMEREVIDAVRKWEPRVVLESARIQAVEGNEHAVEAVIVWKLKDNQRVSSILNVRVEG